MQPTQSSMLRRTSAGTSPRTTTSETAKRPPGFSTRKASRRTASLSLDRLMTQFEMTTSTALSGSGMFSIVPLRNSTLVAPAFFWFSRAGASAPYFSSTALWMSDMAPSPCMRFHEYRQASVSMLYLSRHIYGQATALPRGAVQGAGRRDAAAHHGPVADRRGLRLPYPRD